MISAKVIACVAEGAVLTDVDGPHRGKEWFLVYIYPGHRRGDGLHQKENAKRTTRPSVRYLYLARTQHYRSCLTDMECARASSLPVTHQVVIAHESESVVSDMTFAVPGIQ